MLPPARTVSLDPMPQPGARGAALVNRLAALLGIHRSTVARHERSPDPMPRLYVLALAALLAL